MNKITIVRHATITCFGLAALGATFVSQAKAQCLASLASKPGVVRPHVKAVIPKNSHSQRPSLNAAPPLSIVGMWNVTFTSGGELADEGFDLWHADGTEVLNDTPPPASGNVCLGTWVQSGTTYNLKHLSWSFDENGNLNGMFIIREHVTLDSSGASYTGTYTIDGYDLTGNPNFSQDGEVVGERITVDNLP